MLYRAEIDGLRALCILPVVLFHAGIPAVSGGFVGVDLFFVISGYLITRLIDASISEGRFSFSGFYLRRARRLWAAMSVVLLAVLGLAVLQDTAVERAASGEQVLAGALFFANFFYLDEISYFTDAALEFPLLHFWSLAIEEHFYFLMPALMLVCAGVSRTVLRAAVAVVTVLSFAVSVYFVAAGLGDDAYYHSIGRFWEIGAGACLALAPPLRLPFGNLLRLLAFGAVLVLPFLYSAALPFPGVWAVPVVVSGLILLTPYAPGEPALRILSTPLLVTIGKVSYSWYLWHWVVFSAADRAGLFEGWSKLGWIGLSLALAAASYAFVETPVRRKRVLRADRSFLIAAIGMLALIIGLAALLRPFALRPAAFEGAAIEVEMPLDYVPLDRETLRANARAYVGWDHRASYRFGECFLDRDAGPDAILEACYRATSGYDIALIGDSTAAHFYPGLKAYFPGANILQLNAGGCPPLPGEAARNGSRSCARLQDILVEELLADREIELFIVSAAWQADEVDGVERLLARARAAGAEDRMIVFGRTGLFDRSALRGTRLGLRGLPVGAADMDQVDVAISAVLDWEDPAPVNARIAEIATAAGVVFVPAHEAQGTPGQWRFFTPTGWPIYRDRVHLTDQGSAFMVHRLILENREVLQRFPELQAVRAIADQG